MLCNGCERIDSITSEWTRSDKNSSRWLCPKCSKKEEEKHEEDTGNKDRDVRSISKG